ncbi:MAG: hypothetical protein AAB470_02695 [Patescibacteria group bacterium]
MDKRKIQDSRFKIQEGYTLLFSVLTASLVLGVAVFILSVSTKQYQLSVAARDSLFALYAADSGLECALADYDAGTLSTSTSMGDPNTVFINCNNSVSDSVTFTGPTTITDLNLTNVYQAKDLKIALPNDTCADISIVAGDGFDAVHAPKYKIFFDSLGYNYCTGADPKVSTKTIERGLRYVKIY